jgi:hypothetical protein
MLCPIRLSNVFISGQVENQLFKVHRHFLIQESEIFRDMFSFEKEGEEIEGASDKNPIPLPGVTVKEFELLLKQLYTLSAEFLFSLCWCFIDILRHRPEPNLGLSAVTTERPTIAAVDLRKEQDEDLLLGIAHRFVFDRIFKRLVRKLRPNEIPVIKRIQLGDKYGLREWLLSAYETLLDRTESLTLGEAAALGPDRVIYFIKARDYLHQQQITQMEWHRSNRFNYGQGPQVKTTELVAKMYFL